MAFHWGTYKSTSSVECWLFSVKEQGHDDIYQTLTGGWSARKCVVFTLRYVFNANLASKESIILVPSGNFSCSEGITSTNNLVVWDRYFPPPLAFVNSGQHQSKTKKNPYSYGSRKNIATMSSLYTYSVHNNMIECIPASYITNGITLTTKLLSKLLSFSIVKIRRNAFYNEMIEDIFWMKITVTCSFWHLGMICCYYMNANGNFYKILMTWRIIKMSCFSPYHRTCAWLSCGAGPSDRLPSRLAAASCDSKNSREGEGTQLWLSHWYMILHNTIKLK